MHTFATKAVIANIVHISVSGLGCSTLVECDFHF